MPSRDYNQTCAAIGVGIDGKLNSGAVRLALLGHASD